MTLSLIIPLLCLLYCLTLCLSPIGGSYKKIGYYDMTKGNLSWYGNDKWIGETLLNVISYIMVVLNSQI